MLNLILIIGFYLLVSGATPFYCPVKLRFCVRSNSCIVVRFRPIFATTNIDNKPVARLYKATPKAKYSQEKQIFGFYFQSEERRVEFLSDDYGKRFANKQADENYKKDKKAKNEKEALEVKVGDIFKDSWGI